MRYGCKSVTMDDIARHLAVSKKTLYQFYKDKDEIITTFARNEFACEKDCMQGITAEAENAVDEVMRISRHIRQTFSKMNPALLYEMQKYHVEAWQVYADFRESAVSDQIRATSNGASARGCTAIRLTWRSSRGSGWNSFSWRSTRGVSARPVQPGGNPDADHGYVHPGHCHRPRAPSA